MIPGVVSLLYGVQVLISKACYIPHNRYCVWNCNAIWSKLTFLSPFILHPAFVLYADARNSSGTTTMQWKDFFSYMIFKHSNNEICISNIFYTTYRNYCVYEAIFRHVLKIRYLETSRHLKMKVLCSFRTWLIRQSCSIVSQTLNHTAVKTSKHASKKTTSFMSSKSLCCVTKLYQAILILAWIILKGLNESLICVFWIYI